MNTWMIGKDSMKYYSPEKEDFYSNLNMEDITKADYRHTQKFLKDFEICELDPGNFLTASGLAWQAVLKKTKIKIDIIG